MIRNMNKNKLVFLLAVVCAIGCSSMPDNPGENYKPPTDATFDQQIEKVKADPNLTEDAKANAIKGIEMSRAMSRGGGQAAGKPK